MDWINDLKHIFQRYSGQAGGTAAAPADPHEDFLQVAQTAPSNILASGIAQAFRSDQTPPFAQMLSNLFSQSGPTQQAGVVNQLLNSIGPGAISALPGLGGLTSLLSGGNVTPEQASQISPAQVQQIAAHAEKQNPSIVDDVSNFYAQHPQIMKAAGGVALAIALQHMHRQS
jgi:hypothetical protein